MRKVSMAFGSFDILHPGHLHYLKKASKYGDLVVVVSRDSSIRKIKGRNPFFKEKDRVEMVGSLGFVHSAVLGNEIRKPADIYKVLLKFRPDYIVLGYDQSADLKDMARFLKSNSISARIIRAPPFNKSRYKSSKVAARIVSL